MKFLLKIFLITITLMQAVQAGRYYNTENGRFISRDPLGYVDGMSLYNAYFAENFGTDPTGLWKLGSGHKSKRTAISEEGDTLEKLSKIRNLSENQFRKWGTSRQMEYSTQGGETYSFENLSPNSVLCPGQEVEVPNTVVKYKGNEGFFSYFQQGVNPYNIFDWFDDYIEEYINEDRKQGYKIIRASYSSTLPETHLIGQTANKTLAKFYYNGHGTDTGKLDPFYDGTLTDDKVYVQYGLSGMVLLGCQTSKAHPTWAMNVSFRGELVLQRNDAYYISVINYTNASIFETTGFSR